MILFLVLSLTAINFIINITWALRRKREQDYPLWSYIVIALFCWFPIVIFPLVIAIEKHRTTIIEDKALMHQKLKVVLLCVLVTSLICGYANKVGNDNIIEVVPMIASLIISIWLIIYFRNR